MSDPLEYLFGLERFGIKFGLDNIRTLVEDLGRPDRTFKTIHVAGTNGKGSVTAMVDAVLGRAGYRSARYTSPHLVDLTERFVVDGRPVARDTLVGLVGELQQRIERLVATGRLPALPTFFEVTTAAALELFRRAGVHVAVLEVGLGGRLDATNVITPVMTAITSIDFDHEKYLGHTRREIAGEKAGIIKAGIPVVVGPMDPEALDAIEQVARDRGAPVVRASDGVSIERVPQRPAAPTVIRLRTPHRDYGEIRLALRGAHQISNALVAVRLLECAAGAGIDVPAAAIGDGLANVSWPGRLEHRFLKEGREVILDAAHNPAGAATLAAYLQEIRLDRAEGKPPLVFAVMADKDVRRMFDILLPSVSALILTRSSTARSADPETLAEIAGTVAADLPIVVKPNRHDALAAAWALSPRIVVAGSIFLLGDLISGNELS